MNRNPTPVIGQDRYNRSNNTIIQGTGTDAVLGFHGDGRLTLRAMTVEYTGTAASSVLWLASGEADISSVTIRGGKHAGISQRGSGISIYGNARATIRDSSIRDNESTGTTVQDNAHLSIRTSEISGNSWGIVAFGQAELIVTRVTFDRNALNMRLTESTTTQLYESTLVPRSYSVDPFQWVLWALDEATLQMETNVFQTGNKIEFGMLERSTARIIARRNAFHETHVTIASGAHAIFEMNVFHGSRGLENTVLCVGGGVFVDQNSNYVNNPHAVPVRC